MVLQSYAGVETGTVVERNPAYLCRKTSVYVSSVIIVVQIKHPNFQYRCHRVIEERSRP